MDWNEHTFKFQGMTRGHKDAVGYYKPLDMALKILYQILVAWLTIPVGGWNTQPNIPWTLLYI